MHVRPVVNSLRASIVGQAAVGGDDPAVEAAVAQIADAIEPALHLAALQLAEQAAAEVGAQLPDRTVEVVLVDGDPALRLADAEPEPAEPDLEDFDARITLRLPPTLKGLIEQSATADGDSVNSWVVDALKRRAQSTDAGGRRVTESFDL
ncbi:MAG: DUF1778 domain-containing protein [Ilumatobacter sp.]|uniref:type II toxin -antitoxin system TacA 1-like antitoxin n=1 Tax=Ilumatobacter sp. TaxID=1967498 RepID=UPI00260C9D1D|nr:DUF1778 domain-containing protein [Ilumatobacter sp.]MDJ0767793.1 DUF1778 domain-containing protein [Ilumatobacter sp.]